MMLPTARKWRPQTFDEVVGQDEIVKALKTSISTKRIGQAYLFSGPRGVGKTTISRILAKSLNCVYGPTPVPCNKCENCLEIKDGISVDVVEIDGASNRRIDDVRNIREAVKFVPAKSRYKVYIIDEVHMLTDEAFNALLKTLEEPPAHVVFIFATTEPYKVKPTIRSRCQHFVLRPIPTEIIFKQLKKISEAEGMKLADSIIAKIAKAGNGSLRDAESIFDTVVSYIGEGIYNEEGVKEIDEEEISKLLGVIDVSYIEKFLSSLADRDISGLIKTVNTLYSKGFDLKKLVEELITSFRNLLIMKEFGTDRTLLKALDDEIKVLENVKDRFSKEEVVFIENILVRAYSEMKTSINELFHLENALFRIVNPDNIITLSKVLREIKELKNYLVSNSVKVEGHLSSENEKMSSKSSLKTKTAKIDPADTLMEEIEKTPSSEEVVRQIIAENSLPGVEKKVQLHFSEGSLTIVMDNCIREIVEKDLEKILEKIRSSTGIKEIKIQVAEVSSCSSSGATEKGSKKGGTKTLDEKLKSLFDAKEITSFK